MRPVPTPRPAARILCGHTAPHGCAIPRRAGWAATARVGLAVLALAAAAPARADIAPWTLEARQAISHDNNLYRLSESAGLPAGLSRGDTVSATRLSAGLDQTVSRQRLQAEAALDLRRYADNTPLNHQGHAWAIAWQGSTTERLSGEAWAGGARQLRPFDTRVVDGRALRSLEASKAAGAALRLGGEGPLALEGGWSGRHVDVANAATPVQTLRSDTLQAGLRWRPEGTGTLGLGWRHTEGRYPDLGDEWTSNALDLTARWQPSGASQLWLRLSPIHARHARAGWRDLSGLSGAAQWRWEPTGRLRLTTRLLREAGADAGLERWGEEGRIATPGAVDDARWLTRASISLAHEIGARTRAEVAWVHTRRALVALSSTAALPSESSDRTNQVTLGLRWTPLRSVTLGCDAAVERRSARGSLSSPYGAQVFGCFGSLSLR